MDYLKKMIVVAFTALVPNWGNADVMKQQAIEYYKNRDDDFSPIKAFELFEELAINGDNEAKVFAYATFYEYPKSLEDKATDAIKYLAESAKSGNSKAQYNLGLILTKGLFLEQNIPLANQWLEMSANKGDIQAATILGINLSKEYVLKQNEGHSDKKLLKKAMNFLEVGKATENPDAMRILALFYYLDCQDPQNGVKYLKLAIAYGDEESKQLLEQLYKETGKDSW